MTMKKLLIAALLIAPAAVAAPAAAQTANDRVLTIFGSDPCPRDTICVRAPEAERYRIPKQFRNSGPIAPQNQSWANRAAQLDSIERAGPSQCTVQGPNNWSGCWLQQMRAARADRRNAAQENAADLPK
jgi:hypothetical protein